MYRGVYRLQRMYREIMKKYMGTYNRVNSPCSQLLNWVFGYANSGIGFGAVF